MTQITIIKKLIVIAFFYLLFNYNMSFAEDKYVTDRVILGVHQDSIDSSVLISSLPSGTKVTILETTENFTKIDDGKGLLGWVKSEFLISEKPALIKLNDLTAQYDKMSELYKKSSEDVSKSKTRAIQREKDLQTREDQVANAKTTIRELRKQLKQTQQALQASASTPNTPVDSKVPEINTKNIELLAAATAQIETLQNQIETLQTPAVIENTDQLEPSRAQLNSEIKKLLMRIKVAQANLNGEAIPSPEELAAIQPVMPRWYWVLLLVMIVIGFIIGSTFIDYLNRKKHGGFRL